MNRNHRLYSAVVDVIENEKINYEPNGLLTNLEAWEHNKSGLLSLLSKHPDWNQEELAIPFPINQERELIPSDVRQWRIELSGLGHQILEPEKAVLFQQILYDLCLTNSKTLSNPAQFAIANADLGTRLALGQKTSRAINIVAKKLGVDKHADYMTYFALLADALNPIIMTTTGLLSVHPCDYLLMAHERYGWRSCHRLSGGEWKAGSLSYMNDDSTMIFYAVNDNVKEQYHLARKQTRQVFCYRDGVLLQSRLYPCTDNNDTRTIYRSAVQKAIALCEDAPNLWTNSFDREKLDKYIDTEEGAMQYRDYEFNSYAPNVSLLKTANTNDVKIYVGNPAYCLNCGNDISNTGSLYCNECNGTAVCNQCGCRRDEEDMCWIDGDPYCSDCSFMCELCGEPSISPSNTAHNRRGYIIDVCESCLADFFCCEDCGEYHHKQNVTCINGNWYCNDCLNNNFTVCEKCGQYEHDDDIRERAGVMLCESCADDYDNEHNEEAS